MTVTELRQALQRAEAEGHGELEVMFDTEAQKYDAHFVPVSWAGVEVELPTPCAVLFEVGPHRGS